MNLIRYTSPSKNNLKIIRKRLDLYCYILYISYVRLRDMIRLNTILILKGKTQKGKNRINEHGELWKVTGMKPDKGVMRLESLNNTFKFNGEWRKDVRWVSTHIVTRDENFELVGIHEVGHP